jgi:Flp pilus assembly protein TadG
MERVDEIWRHTLSSLKSKSTHGQALVEFVLVLPIALMILLGVIEFGMLFSEYIFLQMAADHVAQGAARLGGDVPALATVKDNSTIAWMDSTDVAFTVDTLDPDGTVICDGTTDTCRCDYGEFVRVTAAYDTDMHILFFQADLTLETEDSLYCWRGGSP